MSHAIIIAETCQYCSRQLAPADILRAAGGNVRMCHLCYTVHVKTLYRYGQGALPEGCQGCRRTYADLEATSVGGNVRMVLVWKDAIYQILCTVCAELYLPKRGDLFKGTQFGRQVLNL